MIRLLRTNDQRILDLEADIEALKRKLAVAEAEIESMAAVIARDRARIESETVADNRRRAAAEGVTDDRDELGQCDAGRTVACRTDDPQFSRTQLCELNEAGHAAADGTVLNVCERLAIEQGRELTRKMLEASLLEHASLVERSSLSASAPNKGCRPGRAPVE